MIPTLNELVGLPALTAPVELGVVSERYFQSKFGRASAGDLKAQQDVVALRIAILNWAYGGQREVRERVQTNKNQPAGKSSYPRQSR